MKKDQKLFLKNVSILMSGTLIAQIIALVSMPILQRYLYTPEDFALFHWFFELVSIFVGISALRMETGIVIEKNQVAAIQLLKLCMRTVLFSTILVSLTMVVFSFFSTNFQIFHTNIWMLLAFMIALYFMGGIQVFTAYFTRQQLFRKQAENKIAQTSGALPIQFVFGNISLVPNGLILGKIVGAIIGFFHITIAVKNDYQKEVFPSRTKQKELLKHNSDFIKYTTPGTFLGMFINFIFIDMFLMYYGATITGQLGASKHYIGVAFALISNSFSQVFYSKIAELKTKESLHYHYTFWLKRLSVIAFGVVFIIWMIPNNWVVALLGSQWNDLAEVMRIMVIWMAVMFVASSLSYIYIKLNRQKTLLLFDTLHLALVISSVSLSYHIYQDFIITLYWFTIAKVLYYSTVVFITYFFINKFQDTSIEH